MSRYMVCTLVFAVLPALHGCSNHPSDELQGRWTGVSAEDGSGSWDDPASPVKEREITFQEGKYILKEKHGRLEGTYELDQASNPKSIDLLINFPGGTDTQRGIYSVENDRLTLRLAKRLGSDQPRPTNFIITRPGFSQA
jgi:uncharacterized protein (TIGR03067 family)